ncbi:MAG: prepilin-type N-terminal cleavage/methylation domain-containing protein [Mycobacteriales bacterium]
MLARIRKAQENGEGGFTLIELLVVIIIIGILAAIAIPTFLNQRTKGWESSAKSALKNAATAQESYFTDNNAYAADETTLNAEGYNTNADVPLVFETQTDGTTFCMEATHDAGGATYAYGSAGGAPIKGGACAADGTVS